MADQKPKAPTGLRTGGRQLWVAVMEDYILTPPETAVLAEACRTRDELDRLERAVRKLPDLVTTGSMGQARMDPALNELRLHRALFDKLTASLNLPDIDQKIGLRASSRRAQKAAIARWNRRDSGAAAS